MNRRTNNLDAYNLYLKGRFFWSKRTADGLQKSLEYFQKAVELDPDYALAYSGIADSYSLLHVYHVAGFEECQKKAKEAALKALELDSSLAEAHTSLGYVKNLFDGDTQGAEIEFMHAIALNPNYATAHHWYSALLTRMGKLDLALEEVQHALKLDPLSTVLHTGQGFLSARLGDWDGSVTAFRQAIEIDPANEMIRINFALLLIQNGEGEESLSEIRQALELAPESPFVNGVYGRVLYYTCQYSRAIEQMKKAFQMTSGPGGMGHIILGKAYLQNKMYQEALTEFSEAEKPSASYTADTDLSRVATTLRGIALAEMGETNKANKILMELTSPSEKSQSEPCWLGLLYFITGDKDRGLKLMDEAYEEGDMWVRYIKVDPLFDVMRGEPGFTALLGKMGLEK